MSHTLTVDTTHGQYYVSIRRGARVGLLLGPFLRHEDAIARVEDVRRVACQLDPWADFDAFGTLRMKESYTAPGRLNQHPAFAGMEVR